VHDAIKGILSQEGAEPRQILIYYRSAEGEDFRALIEKYNRETQIGTVLQGVQGSDLSTPRLAMLHMIPLIKFNTVAICNGNDYWLKPTKIETQKLMLDEVGTSFVCHPVISLDSAGGNTVHEPCIVNDIITAKDLGNARVDSSSILLKTKSLVLYGELLNSLIVHSTYSLINYLLTAGNGIVWNDYASTRRVNQFGLWNSKDEFERLDFLAVESKQLSTNLINKGINCRRLLAIKGFFYKRTEEGGFKGLELAKLGIGSVYGKKVIPAHEYQIARPSWLDVHDENFFLEPSFALTHPGVTIFEYQNVTVSSDTDFIVKDEWCLVPREILENQGRLHPYQGLLWTTGYHFAALKMNEAKKIEKAIKVGGLRITNYYHFLMETLPKLYLIEKYLKVSSEYILILPDNVQKHPNFITLVRSISPNRKIFFSDSVSLIECDKLIVSEEVSWIPFNLKSGRFPEMKDHIYNEKGLIEFANYLRGVFAKDVDAPKTRKLYLTRHNNRRPYNEDSLLSIATRYGFEAIECQFLSVEEQARLFAEASHIVGPSGAAWTNLLFSSDCRCLSWMPRVYEEFCCFTSLGSLFNSKIKYIESLYETPILSTSEVFRRPYKVDEVVFEKAVRNL
jgi:hypothetical protein